MLRFMFRNTDKQDIRLKQNLMSGHLKNGWKRYGKSVFVP